MKRERDAEDFDELVRTVIQGNMDKRLKRIEFERGTCCTRCQETLDECVEYMGQLEDDVAELNDELNETDERHNALEQKVLELEILIDKLKDRLENATINI